ncbi:MAG: hypothetical protein R3C44_15700 [Chloroflexota bacterium]
MATAFKPDGYSTVSPYLIVDGANETIEFLKQALGAVEIRRYSAEDGGSDMPKYVLMTPS